MSNNFYKKMGLTVPTVLAIDYDCKPTVKEHCDILVEL
jgi:hypothetical protein